MVKAISSALRLSPGAGPPVSRNSKHTVLFWGCFRSDLLKLKLAVNWPLHEIFRCKMLLSENLADIRCISLSCLFSTAPCTTAGQVEGRSPLAFKAYLMHISRSFIGLWLSEELQDSSGPLKINLTSKSANSCPRSVNGLASAIILRAS